LLLVINLKIILFCVLLIPAIKCSYQGVTFCVKSVKEILWELLQCGFLF